MMKISKWLSSGTKKANNAKAGGKPTTLPAYRYRLSPMGYVFRASEERPPARCARRPEAVQPLDIAGQAKSARFAHPVGDMC